VRRKTWSFSSRTGRISCIFQAGALFHPEREECIAFGICREHALTKRKGPGEKTKRKLDGLTQADLAGYCGVGQRFVGELERGKPTVRLDKTLQVLEGLGLELIITRRGE